MRFLFIILTVIAVLAAAVYQFGGTLLSNRMRVIDHRWKIPPAEPATLTDSLAIKATESALRASSRDPSAWLPVPWGAESTSVVHRYSPAVATITLNSNRNSFRPELYARVAMDAKRRVIRVELYRSK